MPRRPHLAALVAAACAVTLLAGCAPSAPDATAVPDPSASSPVELPAVDTSVPDDWTACTYEQSLVTSESDSAGPGHEAYADTWPSTEFPGAADVGRAPVCFVSAPIDPDGMFGYAYFTGGDATATAIAEHLASRGWTITDANAPPLGGTGGFIASYGTTLTFLVDVVTVDTRPTLVHGLGDGEDLVMLTTQWDPEH